MFTIKSVLRAVLLILARWGDSAGGENINLAVFLMTLLIENKLPFSVDATMCFSKD